MTSEFRIAHVVHQLDVGGLERVVVNLITHLPRETWKPSLYCLKGGGALTHEVENDGVPVYDLHKANRIDIALPLRMARQFRAEQIDVVHCHNFGAFLYGSAGARLARRPATMCTAHGVYSADRLANVKFARFFSVDRVVTVSEDARRAMIAGAFEPEQVRTIVNGIDTDLYGSDVDTDTVKAELGLPSGVPIFGIVARLSWEKRHRDLLLALSRVIASVPKAVLVIVGDGALRAELEAFAADRGVASNVYFLGERSDVARVLHAFDVFVLSSELEGLSLTLLEAAATGLPIVATNVGGNSEVVVHGKTGILVEPKSPDALANAMLEVTSDSKRAREMGQLGRKRVVEFYSLAAMLKSYESIYHELLDAR